jgi:DNA-binding CsgD family transcriptional regulator
MIPDNFLQAVASERRISKAELAVLSRTMQGESIAKIALELHISEDAVRKRLSEIYQKFQIVGKGPVKLTKLQQQLVRQYQQVAAAGSAADLPNWFNISSPTPPIKRPAIDWDSAPDVSTFYGRTEELAKLNDWILHQNCRLAAILGMGGIGKTVLGVKLARQIQEHFDSLIWRSLSPPLSLSDLLGDFIQALSPQPDAVLSLSLNGQISWLISHCRCHRCLLVLDGFECLLNSGKLAGTYRQEYANYRQFLRRFAEETSKSCLLLTSREAVSEISLLEGATSPVRSLKLEGMGQAAQQILQQKQLSGEQNWNALIENYGGNPVLLKLAATTVKEVFDGDVSEFLAATALPENVADFGLNLLDCLSDLERTLIFEIVKANVPISFFNLRNCLSATPVPLLMSALTSLRQRSLVEKATGGFIVSPLIGEVIRQLLPADGGRAVSS